VADSPTLYEPNMLNGVLRNETDLQVCVNIIMNLSILLKWSFLMNFCELLKEDHIPWICSIIHYYLKVINLCWFYSDTILLYSVSHKFLTCGVLSCYL
jgi:hypothetical protein